MLDLVKENGWEQNGVKSVFGLLESASLYLTLRGPGNKASSPNTENDAFGLVP